jgi:hypothetical protein
MLNIYITANLVENIITHMQNGNHQKEGDGLAQNKKIFTTMAQNKKIFTTIAPLSTIVSHPSPPAPPAPPGLMVPMVHSGIVSHREE